jgi:hypothetical protein
MPGGGSLRLGKVESALPRPQGADTHSCTPGQIPDTHAHGRNVLVLDKEYKSDLRSRIQYFSSMFGAVRVDSVCECLPAPSIGGPSVALWVKSGRSLRRSTLTI